MNILIVSGFLGAGKTTFIKELIRRTGTNPVILENEYGDNSIDAQELRATDKGPKKLEILEFMEGCVCCTMKDSFINSVLTVYSSLSPEYLIIEPTGVGKLSNIINNLKPMLHGDVRLLNPIVVIAPRSYHRNMQEWEELYTDQVANARTVIFSKCEKEDPDVLAEAETAIRAINPDAQIISSHYSGQSDEWWRSIMSITDDYLETTSSEGESAEFSQITLTDARLNNPGELVILLEDCLRGEMGHMARAKGTIPVGKEMLRFDLADNLYSISGLPEEASEEASNQCVFIGKELDAISISKRMGTSFTPQKKTSLARAYASRNKNN